MIDSSIKPWFPLMERWTVMDFSLDSIHFRVHHLSAFVQTRVYISINFTFVHYALLEDDDLDHRNVESRSIKWTCSSKPLSSSASFWNDCPWTLLISSVHLNDIITISLCSNDIITVPLFTWMISLLSLCVRMISSLFLCSLEWYHYYLSVFEWYHHCSSVH